MVLKEMSGKEFVNKILRGERDFSEIKLEDSFNLSNYEGFKELQKYLKKQNFYSNPINVQNSEFMRFQAKGLYLPYIKGEHACFRGANLAKADFRKAHFEETDFKRANLGRANFRKANLARADFRTACLEEANLRKANLEGGDFWLANLSGACLEEANLRVANLEGANLSRADLREANLSIANLKMTNFRKAYLKHVKNLSHAFYLETADFLETKVSREEFAIIEKVLNRRKLFEVV